MFKLSRRKGSAKWQVRKRWPADVAPILKGEFTKSTGEEDRKAAQAQLPYLAAEYEKAVAEARAKLAEAPREALSEAEGDAFVSRLPIALDGSNSGLQHFTALLRDPIAAPHVNLVGNDRPGDIFAHIASLAQEVVDQSAEPQALVWRGGKITRGIAKGPCMTYAYAATRQGMAGQIEEALRELDRVAAAKGQPPHLGGEDNRAAAFWLAGLFRRLLQDAVPAMRSAMDWLRGL